MTPTPAVFAGATVVLMLAMVASMPRPERHTVTHPAVVGASVLFLLSLVVWALCVQPTLIHADVVAPELVDCVLQFPRVCTTRGGSYGQYGFLLVGFLARLFGGDLNAVFHAMEVVGALNIVLLAVLAQRLSGSPYGALFAVAVAGTNPIFMRVAASEEMHNAGLLLGLVAFVAMDIFAVTRRTTAIVASVLALCLMVHTRQTFHIFVPCVFLLGLARGGRDLLKCGRFWGAGVVVLAVLMLRIVDMLSGTLSRQMMAIYAEPVLLHDMLRYHPLLDLSRFGALPVLTVAAVIWACFDGRLARATAAVFAANFVVTYPVGMPSPGVEFAQRLAVYAFGALLVAMAGAGVLEGRVGESRRAVAGLFAAGVLLALPPLFPGWRALSTLTPIHREYLAVESAAAALPQEFTLITVPTAAAALAGDVRYAGLLARMGKRVHVAPARDVASLPRPWLFLEDIECWTYTFNDLTGIQDANTQGHTLSYRWDHVLFGRQRSTVRPPPGPRSECQPFVGSRTLGPRLLIVDPDDDPPFLFYASSVVPVQFHEVVSLVPQ